MKGVLRRLFVLCCLGLVFAVWGFWYEPSTLRVQGETISVPDWPTACRGKRIAILADLHVGSPYKGLDSLESLVEETNGAKPDLILLPGDFVIQGIVGGRFVTPENAAKVLAGLHAPMGVYAVLGNHDWWLDAERVEQALSQNGITVLEDRSIQLVAGECQLQLVGISDYWEGPHDIDKALQEVVSDIPILAFTHNPDIFPKLPDGISLTVAGHTHGGQVSLPIIGAPVVPSEYGQRYVKGHVVENGRHLFVSSGVGTSILPVRFMVPPEVIVLLME